MRGRGCAWQLGGCVAGSMHDRGHAWGVGVCMAGGHVWL